MSTAIVHPPAPSVDLDLSEIVLAYLQAQQDVSPSMLLIEAMAVELAQIEHITGDSEFGDSELVYAYKIASGQEVGFEDLPACLWP